MRRTKTRPRGRPARPGQEGHAHAHTHGTRAWRPLTRKKRCWRQHKTAPVHRPSPQSQGGRYRKTDASVTGSTPASHRSARSPRPTPEGPARDNPIAGPRAGTMRSEPSAPASVGATGRNKEPGSRQTSMCPTQPPSRSGGASPRGGERHHGVGKADWSTESDRTGRGASHQRGATRHARETRRRLQPRHTDRCQATTATGCREPEQPVQPGTNHGTGTGARRQPAHTPHAPARSGEVQAERANKHTHTPTPQPGVAGLSQNPSPSTHTNTTHPSQEWRGTSGARTQTHTHPNNRARSGASQPKPEPKHTHSHRTPQPGVAGYKRSTHMNTHTPQQPSQQWRGAVETRAQAHTPTPHAPARSGGVQAEGAHIHTRTPTAKPGVAGRSANRSPSTHTRTAHPGQEWRGTSGARTQTHIHPNTPARSGGAQPKPEPNHTHPRRTPDPGVVGHKRSAQTKSHPPQHPSQDWRGGAETRVQAHTPTPHTPARSAGAQAKRAHKHTQTPTPLPRVAGRSQNLNQNTHTHTSHTPARSGRVQAERAHKHTRTPTPQPGVAGAAESPCPSTHTHTAHPSQEWRGTSGARTQTHTHPISQASNGGAQPKPEPKHTHPHRTSQPGVAGYKRSAHTHTHTHTHPNHISHEVAPPYLGGRGGVGGG